METSAKTGFNAQDLFVEAGKLLFAEYGPPAVVTVILADTGKDGHVLVGDGEV